MFKANMTRRGFAKLAAVVGATVSSNAFLSGRALADVSGSSAGASDTKIVRSCCRACGKNECGVYVTVQDGRVVKVEGDADTAFHSMGNCCTKSQASIQAAYHPDRLYHPMKRTNPKGEADPGWVRITWDEAYATIAEKFQEIVDKHGPEALFFMGGTSRIWTQHAYAAWPQMFGSPNSVTAWQICKGPRHFATDLVSEYEFSWMATTDRPRVFVAWGGASEISNYDESCRTTVDIAKTADSYICVDPRTTNLGREADLHQHLKPGTDGALALAWTNVVIENGLYDDLYVKRWTDAPFLVVEGMKPSGGVPVAQKLAWWPGKPMATRLLKECDLREGGSPLRFMVWDELAGSDEAHPLHENDPSGHLTYFDAQTGLWEGEPDEIWDKFRENPQPNLPKQTVPGRIAEPSPFDPEIDPALYGTFEVTLADGTTHDMKPVWEHYTARAAEYAPEKAQEITGVPADQIEKAALTWATPLDPSTGYGNGGLQYMLAPEHACNAIQNNRIFDNLCGITGNMDTPAGQRGPTYGTYTRPDDSQPTLSSKHGKGVDFSVWPEKQLGVDKIPMLGWWQQWADANSVHDAILTGDPYPVVGGLCEASGFMNQGNSLKYYEALCKLDFFFVMELWKTPTAGTADILLPVCHWTEVDCPRVSQGSTGAQGATCRAIDPPADCRFDPQIVVDVYQKLGIPYIDEPVALGYQEGEYWPTAERQFDNLVLAAGYSNWQEYRQAFQEHGWWDCRAIAPETWGTYRRYETGMLSQPLVVGTTPAGNPMKGFTTPTRKQEIWSTAIETYMPEAGYELPSWEPAPETELANPSISNEWPFLMTTGRRIPVYFHSEHRQLPWCRELWPVPRVEINPVDAQALSIEQGDWVWIESPRAKVRQVVDLYYGIEPGVINCEHQWWFPELHEAKKGFDLCNINCLVEGENQDPVCGASNLRAYHVKVYKATPENSPFGNPVPCGDDGTEIIHDASDPRLREWLPNYEIREGE
ncbi:molybdopterin-dependent oxidoreductase [Eggerthella guodeyinii]|uniref:Molybdopterin-dependent oxidoreductase n=1 Tax=Eggerthella guodeyinii TaxID=2690837 RepID=A0A6L7IWJ9_9ACTN|nr:molybdopterin-dependent oxidoreductase [Eggerthella guodeyinii]QOS68854.1 molybdopterin-dependent oxidoreductase [Eggerthella guodeyinii]